MHLSIETLTEHAQQLEKTLNEYNALWQQCSGSLNYVRGQIEQLKKSQEGVIDNGETIIQEEECAA